ncbi:hypothetical protein FRB93_008360 [Tulasnella sp. JGI-2019a]|nr:hypothetical protein FRB93_008360 [Tulasnella sp. JGI-2019a]
MRSYVTSTTAICSGPQDRKLYLILIGMGAFEAEDGKRLWGRFLKLGPIMSKTAQIPYNAYTKKASDMMLSVTLKAPMSAIIWEFYYYDLVPTVPMEAAAFPQRTKAKRAIDEIQAVVSSSSTGSAQTSIGFLNYADILGSENETDANARRAYGSKYPRLQELKRKYDPEIVFNKWFCIRPA